MIGSATTVLGSASLYQAVHSKGSPFAVRVNHGPTRPDLVRVAGTGVSLMTAGVVGTFSLAMRDEWNNPITVLKQDQEIITVYASFPEFPVTLEGASVLNGSNATTLYVPYQSTVPRDVLANHTLTLGGQSRIISSSSSSSPPHLINGSPATQHIKLSISEPLKLTSSSIVGQAYTVRLLPVIKSKWGSTSMKEGNGVVEASIRVTRASVMSLYAQSAKAGGLSASYHNNSDLQGVPSLSRLDGNIDFSGSSPDQWPGLCRGLFRLRGFLPVTTSDQACAICILVLATGASVMNASATGSRYSVKWKGFIVPQYLQVLCVHRVL